MRKNILLCALTLACFGLASTSCNKVASSLIQPQDVSWTGIDVTVDVPATNDTLLHGSMGTGTFSYNLDSFIKSKTANLLGMSNIDNFTFKSCKLTIQNPDADNNFQNFQLAEAVFFTNVNATSANLGEIDNNPNTYATDLDVPINNTANIKSYLPNSGPVTITYVFGGKLRKATTKVLTVNVHVEYNIHVK